MRAIRRCINCMEELEEGASLCPHCGHDNAEIPSHDRNLPAGYLLADRYLLGRVLGSGGFGITYLTYDQQLARKVAVKEFFPSDFATRQPGSTRLSVFTGDAATFFFKAKDGFMQEAKSLAAFAGRSGIVGIYDSFEANDTAYIVMEYLEGRTLKELLQAKGKLSYPDSLTIMVPVLEALEDVHNAGIIHRDVSPDNIFVRTNGTMALIDFGAARTYTSDAAKSMTVVLKPGYAPIEQYHSKGSQGPWTDVYAVAATIYRMITGVAPDESVVRTTKDTTMLPSELGADIPYESETALMAGLAIQPEDRTKTVLELLEGLIGQRSVDTVPQKQKTVVDAENLSQVDESHSSGDKTPQKNRDNNSNCETSVSVGNIASIVIFSLFLLTFLCILAPRCSSNTPVSQNISPEEDKSIIEDQEADSINLKEEDDTSDDMRVGDIVHLGEFSFDTQVLVDFTLSNGKNSGNFEWQVLEVQSDRVLIVSRDVIAREPYHGVGTSVTWETSDIRKWLNDDFLRSLPADLQSRIVEVDVANNDNAGYETPGGNDTKDKIFLLSLDEAERYFGSDEARISTLDMKGDYKDGAVAWWWLRSPGSSANRVAGVDAYGSVDAYGIGVDYDYFGVRPVLWLDL